MVVEPFQCVLYAIRKYAGHDGIAQEAGIVHAAADAGEEIESLCPGEVSGLTGRPK